MVTSSDVDDAAVDGVLRSVRFLIVEAESNALGADARDVIERNANWHALLAASRKVRDAPPPPYGKRGVLAARLQFASCCDTVSR